MAKARIKINQAEARRLLQGAEVHGTISRRTNAVARAAGTGFEGETVVVGGSNKLGRVMGFVRTSNAKGRARQAKSPVLQRALSAGAGD